MPIAKTRLETLQVCKLLQCVREEDKEQIEKLILNGVPQLINYNDPNEGETALGLAAANNNDTMLEFLLELGAHPDVVDFQGRSAVMRAAEYGHVQCMEKLTKAGADMKITDASGKGIIFYCINSTQRHQSCLALALQHGAEVNNKSKDGVPVFLHACETSNENEEMCLMLLKKGADANLKHQKSLRSPLMAACASGSAKVVRGILEKGADVDQVMMRTKVHAAHEAARGGFLDCLQVMSAYKANFDQMDEKGDTPIHHAAKAGHAMCCKFLSQRGCNPKPKNADGSTARVVAKDEGHKEAVKECRKAEKTFGKIGKNNEPASIELYDFCYEKQDLLRVTFQKFDADGTGFISKEDFVEGLENAGAPLPEVNELKKIVALYDKNRDGTVEYGDFLVGKKYVNKNYLMSAFEGKKKKKKGGKGKKKKGKTKIPMPICTQPDGPRAEDGGPPEAYIARHLHYTDTGRFDRDKPPKHPLEDDSAWYLDHPERAYMSINDAVKHNDLDSLKDALYDGTGVDTSDKYYKTPLMVAAATGNIKVVKFLVENGANVNARDNFKWTPLHFAAHGGLLDVVQYLLEQGAHMEAVTVNGATPLMRAIESSRPDVVQFLIDKGAKVQIENKKGQNPVDIAVAFADSRVHCIVQAKWDSLPPPSDKKKKGKGGKKSAGKRPKSSQAAQPQGGGDRANSPGQENLSPERQRKGSILRAASALAGGMEEQEDITYVPLKTWTDQPTTKDLICERRDKRDRYTWQVDFPDFKMPFLQNITNKVEAEGGIDDD